MVMLTSGASPNSNSLTRFTYTEYHMGVDARIVVYARDKQTAENACAAAFERIAELDSMMSDYRPSSELMQLCNHVGGEPQKVSPELFKVLARSQEIAKLSDGYFDITVGPAVALWRKARKTGVAPAHAEIEQAMHQIGWQKLRLDARRQTVQLLVKGMKLDLGGIAKGYADDEAQRVLKKKGIQEALVEMGGDIVVTGPPPGTKGWTIRIPNAGTDKGPADMIFANCAVSTSGDTEQFVVIGGTRYSHVIDPHTGMALTSRVQATVIATDGLTSDPLSTALTLLPESNRKKLLRAYPRTKSYVRTLQ